MPSVVIAGASAAGLATATALRRKGFAGRITVLGDELPVPYDRPPLSKQYLSGAWAHEKLRLMPQDRLGGLGLDLRLGHRATALHRADHTVEDDQGQVHVFDHLVVATGLRPRTLPATDVAGIQVLRTISDAERLRSVIAVGARLVIVGAGFLGMEIAATACGLGADVTVIEPVARPLADRLGDHVSARLLELHRSHGVKLLLGVGVQGFATSQPGGGPYTPSGGEPGNPRPVRAVHLTDGRLVDADAVLVAIGAEPCTDWLAGSGLTIDDGVVCDEYCRAAPGIWAAGDVARWRHVGLGRHVRLEHRTNATEQGQAVAAGIVGQLLPYVPVPFFWTDHFDARIQVAGVIPAAGQPRVVVGDSAGNSFVTVYLANGRLAAALAWNASRELMPYRRQLVAPAERLRA
jgi:3-phenylpropionate/trans-cinnamate dioxygenase ferredoxin reductase component